MNNESPFATTPEPPYVAVIFASARQSDDAATHDGYEQTAREMVDLVSHQPGFLGMEAAREGIGLTVSYWSDESAALAWKAVADHLIAQRRGRTEWYADYVVRVATVTRHYTKATSTFSQTASPKR